MNSHAAHNIWRGYTLGVALLLALVAAALSPLAALAGPTYFGENFNTAPVLLPSGGAGGWYQDRYRPAAFNNAMFDGDMRLHIGISSADVLTSRPPAYAYTFYNTQGRKFDLWNPTNTYVASSLYVPQSWATGSHRTDMWATAFDGAGNVTGYPIVGFTSGIGFRVWVEDGPNAGWYTIGYPAGFSYDRWYSLRIELTPDAFLFYIDGKLVYTDTYLGGSTQLGNVMMEAYDYEGAANSTYDVYYDDLSAGALDRTAPVTTDDHQATYVSSASVKLSAADGGSGIAHTQYKLDGGAWTYGTTVSTSVLGSHTLSYRSIDFAGNPESATDVTFSVVAPTPVLDSLSSYHGGPGTEITFSGSNFGATQGTGKVLFGGAEAQIVSWSDTSIVAVVPADAQAGYASVDANGQSTAGLYFVPTDMATVQTLDKPAADVGSELKITGFGFGDTQGANSVTVAGASAAVISWSDTQIIVTVPDAPAGYVGIWKDGVCSNGIFFVPGSEPAIDSVSTQVTIVGDTVTVNGKNFGSSPMGATPLTLGGLPVTPTSWSDSQITFQVPPTGLTGYLGVWKGGVCSNGIFMNVGGRVLALSAWWAAPGTEMTIDGEGFGNTADRVTVGGVDAQITSWSDTHISFIVPDGPEGYVGVWKNGVCSNGIWLLPIRQARVESVDTTQVPVGTDTTITINGTDFGSSQDTNFRVMIGTNEIPIVSWSDTQIVATVPSWLVDSGYLGVWKKGVASNGTWVDVLK